MQLFTTEQLIEVRAQAWGFAREFTISIVQALWQNVVDFLPALVDAFSAKDWGEALLRVAVLIGSVVMLYRFIRKMPLRVFSSIR